MRNKYIVSNQPSFGILDKGYSRHNFGSLAIKKKIIVDRRKLFICSHIYEDFGVEKLNKAIVINCACMKGYIRRVIFDIDSNSCEEVLLK